LGYTHHYQRFTGCRTQRRFSAIYQKLSALVKKYEESFRYVLVGTITTGISFAVYTVVLLLTKGITWDYHIANAVSFVISVTVAFFLNRRVVFRVSPGGKRNAFRQGAAFFVMRLVSFGVSAGLLALMVDVAGMDKLLAKIIENIFIILINYVISKRYIFNG